MKNTKIRAKIVKLSDLILGFVLELYSKLGGNTLFTSKQAVRSWIRKIKTLNLPSCESSIVVVGVEFKAWIEWAFFCSCWLRWLGYRVIFVYSSEDLSKIYTRNILNVDNRRIFDIFLKLPDLVTVDIDAYKGKDDICNVENDKEFLKLLHSQTAYETNLEEHENSEHSKCYQAAYVDMQSVMRDKSCTYFALLKHLSQKYKTKKLCGFSGLIGSSGVIEYCAKKLSWRTIWVEAFPVQPGLLQWNIDGGALKVDLGGKLRKITFWDESNLQKVNSFLDFQESGFRSPLEETKFKRHYQICRKGTLPEQTVRFIEKDDRPIFVAGPNVIGDSVTLQVQTIFDSQREWLEELIEYFRVHEEYKLIIRGHPGERFLKKRCLTISDILSRGIDYPENILIVFSCAHCNTYELIRKARSCLVWISDLGVDSVLLGKPALCAASARYSGMGFVEEAGTKSEYYEKIEKIASGQITVLSAQKSAAKKYYQALLFESNIEGFGSNYSAAKLSFDIENGSMQALYKLAASDLRDTSLLTTELMQIYGTDEKKNRKI